MKKYLLLLLSIVITIFLFSFSATASSEPTVYYTHGVLPNGTHFEIASLDPTALISGTLPDGTQYEVAGVESDDYVLEGVKIFGGAASYFYNPTGTNPNVTNSTISSAVTGWNGITSNLKLTYGGNTTVTSNLCTGSGPDGQNTIKWAPESGSIIATTCWQSNGAYITEADIIIGNSFPSIDFRTVLLHEMGHTIGLAHSSVPSAVMYFQYHGAIPPQPDDIAGVCAIYGCTGGIPTPTPTSTPTSTPTFTPTSTPTVTSTPTATPTRPKGKIQLYKGWNLVTGDGTPLESFTTVYPTVDAVYCWDSVNQDFDNFFPYLPVWTRTLTAFSTSRVCWVHTFN